MGGQMEEKVDSRWSNALITISDYYRRRATQWGQRWAGEWTSMGLAVPADAWTTSVPWMVALVC